MILWTENLLEVLHWDTYLNINLKYINSTYARLVLVKSGKRI